MNNLLPRMGRIRKHPCAPAPPSFCKYTYLTPRSQYLTALPTHNFRRLVECHVLSPDHRLVAVRRKSYIYQLWQDAL